ncbi:MAG: thioredoxin [Fibrobacterota bacterium]
MATVELTKENINDVIETNDIVLIDFWASWCGPCKMFGPVFEKVSEKYPDITFAKCNTEEQPELAGSFGVSSIPTLSIIREKIGVFSQAGALPENALEDVIGQVQNLDMDDVRKEVEKEKAKEQ